MKTLLIILILIHGTIHLLGFVKALDLAHVSQLKQHISKVNGVLWLITVLLFLSTALLIFLNKDF